MHWLERTLNHSISTVGGRLVQVGATAFATLGPN